jgi:hypothetical protein
MHSNKQQQWWILQQRRRRPYFIRNARLQQYEALLELSDRKQLDGERRAAAQAELQALQKRQGGLELEGRKTEVALLVMEASGGPDPGAGEDHSTARCSPRFTASHSAFGLPPGGGKSAARIHTRRARNSTWPRSASMPRLWASERKNSVLCSRPCHTVSVSATNLNGQAMRTAMDTPTHFPRGSTLSGAEPGVFFMKAGAAVRPMMPQAATQYRSSSGSSSAAEVKASQGIAAEVDLSARQAAVAASAIVV